MIFDARRGYVVTNHHVIDHAEEIAVTLSDGRVLLAKLIGVDPQLDLAVLQIGADHLSQVALADSATRVGDFVVAIGNPFGLGRTVTTGVVSALGRGAFAPEHYEDFIQTDASINSGNSGGALVDLRGDLVGINVAVVAPAGGNVGIGFAIPSAIVSAIASRLIERGVVQHGSLGMRAVAGNTQLATSFNVDAGNGVVVVAVEKDSGAARAGIVPGDVIVEIDGHRADQVADFYARSALVMVGDSVKLTLRRGGKSMTVTIDVAAANR